MNYNLNYNLSITNIINSVKENFRFKRKKTLIFLMHIYTSNFRSNAAREGYVKHWQHLILIDKIIN